jgi:hypothetical protein
LESKNGQEGQEGAKNSQVFLPLLALLALLALKLPSPFQPFIEHELTLASAILTLPR